MLIHTDLFYFFLLAASIPVCDWTIVYFSIPLVMDF